MAAKSYVEDGQKKIDFLMGEVRKFSTDINRLKDLAAIIAGSYSKPDPSKITRYFPPSNHKVAVPAIVLGDLANAFTERGLQVSHDMFYLSLMDFKEAVKRANAPKARSDQHVKSLSDPAETAPIPSDWAVDECKLRTKIIVARLHPAIIDNENPNNCRLPVTMTLKKEYVDFDDSTYIIGLKKLSIRFAMTGYQFCQSSVLGQAEHERSGIEFIGDGITITSPDRKTRLEGDLLKEDHLGKVEPMGSAKNAAIEMIVEAEKRGFHFAKLIAAGDDASLDIEDPVTDDMKDMILNKCLNEFLTKKWLGFETARLVNAKIKRKATP